MLIFLVLLIGTLVYVLSNFMLAVGAMEPDEYFIKEFREINNLFDLLVYIFTFPGRPVMFVLKVIYFIFTFKFKK